MKEMHYEVVVVGGGISGSALVYLLSRYTNIKSIALVEKYEGVSTLNSKGTGNSQTIHSGDIETNYTYEKAKKVKKTADMIVKYGLQHGYNEQFMFKHQKFAMGVGEEEVESIKQRYNELKKIYPYLEFYDRDRLKQIEPKVVFDENSNVRKDNVAGIGTLDGAYTTVDFGAMSNSFVDNAKKENSKHVDVYLNSEVKRINQVGDKFYINTINNLSISADFVVVNAGAHSLYLAHKMGYGMDMGTLPMAGSYYLTKKKLLNGKVYMIQNPKLPFAALHGDPDILADGCTRFGPTAIPMPKLERFHGSKSILESLSALNLGMDTISVFWDLLKDSDIRNYLFRNIAFEMPILGKKLFVKDARKIVPSLREDDIYYAKGFGGIRPQVIDKKNKTLMLGEASIDTKKGIIFNMTPSPGATSCLGNGVKDAKKVCEFLNKSFDEAKFESELG